MSANEKGVLYFPDEFSIENEKVERCERVRTRVPDEHECVPLEQRVINMSELKRTVQQWDGKKFCLKIIIFLPSHLTITFSSRI